MKIKPQLREWEVEMQAPHEGPATDWLDFMFHARNQAWISQLDTATKEGRRDEVLCGPMENTLAYAIITEALAEMIKECPWKKFIRHKTLKIGGK